jgi:hypothetical protein
MGDSAAMEKYRGDTLGTDGTTREQKLAATTAVMRRVPEAKWHDVLGMLFAEAHSSAAHGSKATPEIYAARQAWLDRCRAWIRTQGREPAGAAIRKSDQRDYEAATGDVWGGGTR